MFETVKQHEASLNACQELVNENLKDIKSCTAIAKDLVELDVVVANISAQAATIYADGVKIVAKFNTCGFKLINKQIKCLEECYTSATALVAKAKEEFTEFETDIETLVTKIEADIQSCDSDTGFSSERFNAVLSQCKSRFL